jgi:hypothetical protein
MRPLAKDVRELKIENSKKQFFKYLNLFLLKKVLCGAWMAGACPEQRSRSCDLFK